MDLKKVIKSKYTHKERVAKVKDFANNNKIFTAISLIAVIFLLFNFFSVRLNPPAEIPENLPAQSEMQDGENEAAAENTEPSWRFYWLDVWIFGIGGGFCFVMILKERKKRRMDL